MTEKPKILFMGTPDFAIPSLEILVRTEFHIAAVVTQPDRPRGRGRKSEPPPVKAAAEQWGIRVLQPERVRDESFLRIFREIAPDMVVLVAFGQILPREIIDFPRHGCINVHPSLLPKYRGAAPINWALIRGETETGVSIIEMSDKVDAGRILLQAKTQIGAVETFGELHDRLSRYGANLLLRAVKGVLDGTMEPIEQEDSLATQAPRIRKEDGRIDWNRSAREIVNLIRGLSPVPGACSRLQGKQLKIYRASPGSCPLPDEIPAPGTIIIESGQRLQIAAGDGCVELEEVQIEGKKRMPAREFLKGHSAGGGKLES